MSTSVKEQAITWIGLGSNMDDPAAQLISAVSALRQLPATSVLALSSLYESEPFGPVAQANFINAVAKLTTRLEPEELLDHLQAIEQQHQRKRDIHWGPRTLDLDILLYDNQIIDTPRLTVPHPYLGERNFVVYPLLEVASDLALPCGTSLQELSKTCPLGQLKRLNIAIN